MLLFAQSRRRGRPPPLAVARALLVHVVGFSRSVYDRLPEESVRVFFFLFPVSLSLCRCSLSVLRVRVFTRKKKRVASTPSPPFFPLGSRAGPPTTSGELLNAAPLLTSCLGEFGLFVRRKGTPLVQLFFRGWLLLLGLLAMGDEAKRARARLSASSCLISRHISAYPRFFFLALADFLR